MEVIFKQSKIISKVMCSLKLRGQLLYHSFKSLHLQVLVGVLPSATIIFFQSINVHDVHDYGLNHHHRNANKQSSH